MGLEDGPPKKSGLKGGPSKNNKGKGESHKHFGNTLRWDMFYYSSENISPQKQTKKVFKSPTDKNFKAMERNEQKGFLFLYLLNFHLCIAGVLNLFSFF